MGKKYTRNFYSYSKLDINKGEYGLSCGIIHQTIKGG